MLELCKQSLWVPLVGAQKCRTQGEKQTVKTVPEASNQSNDSHYLLASKQANTLFCRCPETLWKAEFKGMG